MSRNYDAFIAPMIKKYYVLAIVSLILIPAVTMVGATVALLIDPEIAVHYANYERNFRILNQLKLGVDAGRFCRGYRVVGSGVFLPPQIEKAILLVASSQCNGTIWSDRTDHRS